jgi:hypothetical protein
MKPKFLEAGFGVGGRAGAGSEVVESEFGCGREILHNGQFVSTSSATK